MDPGSQRSVFPDGHPSKLSSFHGSVKCVAISKQWVTAVEDCEGNCRHCDELATYPVRRPLQDLQVLGYRNKKWAIAQWSERIGEDFTFTLWMQNNK